MSLTDDFFGLWECLESAQKNLASGNGHQQNYPPTLAMFVAVLRMPKVTPRGNHQYCWEIGKHSK